MITINITAEQILDPRFIHYMTQEVDPRIREKICLEILESEFVERSDATLNALRKLKKEKTRIAIDDFGAGYSSLTYLRDFPVDYLKLDRSLMNVLRTKLDKNHHHSSSRDLIFLSSVINLGKALGCTVIAEGVETAIQDQNLRLLGCDHGQGYFYSPLIDNLDQLIQADNFLH
jgi:EAL domain-containing protein (putative c-di-GMP-specific phosphodiesterase class I)